MDRYPTVIFLTNSLLVQSVSESVETNGSRFLAEFQRLKKVEPDSEEGQLDEECIPQLLALFIQHVPLLFEKGSEADAESSVQLVIHHLLSKLPERDSGQLAISFATAISANARPLTCDCLVYVCWFSARQRQRHGWLACCISTMGLFFSRISTISS